MPSAGEAVPHLPVLCSSAAHPGRLHGSATQGETHLPGPSVGGKGGDLLPQAIVLSPPSHRPPPSQRECHPVGQNQTGSLKRQHGLRSKSSPGVGGSLRVAGVSWEVTAGRHGHQVKKESRGAPGLKSLESEAGRSRRLRGVAEGSESV